MRDPLKMTDKERNESTRAAIKYDIDCRNMLSPICHCHLELEPFIDISECMYTKEWETEYQNALEESKKEDNINRANFLREKIKMYERDIERIKEQLAQEEKDLL